MLLQDLREREDRTELEERMVMKIATLMHSILSVQGFGGVEEDIKGDVSRNLSKFKQWELPPN